MNRNADTFGDAMKRGVFQPYDRTPGYLGGNGSPATSRGLARIAESAQPCGVVVLSLSAPFATRTEVYKCSYS